jgi:CO/xanthine dehydrogenase Mo-binding subunit
MNETRTALGMRLPRLDSAAKAAGEAEYTDDLIRPGMLHAAIAFSPLAHAKILRYDTSAAGKLPGVAAVITGEDFKRVRGGVFLKDEPPMAQGKVRYLGEPVAAVAAADRATALRAARLVEIEYEELPAILTIDQALDRSFPMIHEDLAEYYRIAPSRFEHNVLWEATLAEGDVDAAWGECDVIVEGEFETPAQQHVYLEPCSTLAEPDRNGRLTLWSSCQSVHLVQQKVADYLGIPMARIRALAPHIGGGFGGKGGLHGQHIAGRLALATGRPIKLTLTRGEDFEMVRSRHPVRMWIKTGAKRDGRIIARDTDLVFDGGAYADESPAVMSFGALISRGPYRIANVRARGRVVYTNKLRAGPFRGFGNPQATFAGESQIDELAAKLGLDPVELRLRNLMDHGDRWFGGQPVPACGAKECLIAVRGAIAAAGRAGEAPPGRRRGLGYALVTHSCGLLSNASQVHLRADGSAAVETGVVDIGQGSDTVLTQIAAEALGLPVERVSFSAPDTDSSPYNWKTAASRTTYMNGRSVLASSIQVRERLFDHAAEMLECAREDLELRPGGFVGIRGVPESKLPFAAIAGRAMNRTGGPIFGADSTIFDGPPLDPKRAAVNGFAFANVGVYIFGAQATEIEVDEATGQVRVLRAWSAHDVGRALNPLLIEGQIHGAFVQGLGLALTEEMLWEDDGRLANPSLMDYKIPGVLDVPDQIVPIILETPEPGGPFGAKGMAEAPLCGVPAAIANALAAATGVRLRKIPLTPERVLKGLLEKQ